MITVSSPNNIGSPNGNSLALFKNAESDDFVVKDINGKIEVIESVLLNHKEEYIVNGMVLNLASQGGGGYDFMEWTSTVTPASQIPLWKNPIGVKIKAITFSWMGEQPL